MRSSSEPSLEERGHQATVEPLLQVSFEDADAIDLDGVQALIATSRNGLRALKSHPALAEARRLPLFAVGEATAKEARALGFEMVVTGAGTAQELVVHIVSAVDPAAGLLLHLAGDTLAGDLRGALEEHGFRVLQPRRLPHARRHGAVRGHGRAAGDGRDRRRHTVVAAHRSGVCDADAQAGPGDGGARAHPFLPVAAVARRLEPLGDSQDARLPRPRAWKKCLP